MTQWRHLEHVLQTTTALVNTGPPAAETDELPDVDAVRAFIQERIITEVEDPTASDVTAIHAVRSRLRAVFTAPDEEARTALVNDLLASATILPRISNHDGLGSHLHYFPPYATLSEHLVADCAMALAFLLTSGDSDRLRVCQRPGCARVLLDTTRNRSRTYCDSVRCGNRMHAAAYRERKRRASA